MIYDTRANPISEGIPKFSGNCMGVDLSEDGSMFTLCVEDDESWFAKETVNTFWLRELIEKLQEAERYLQENYEKHQWGYRPKEIG